MPSWNSSKKAHLQRGKTRRRHSLRGNRYSHAKNSDFLFGNSESLLGNSESLFGNNDFYNKNSVSLSYNNDSQINYPYLGI